MITRDRIVEGLKVLAVALTSPTFNKTSPDGWQLDEWAYVKGVAAAALIGMWQDEPGEGLRSIAPALTNIELVIKLIALPADLPVVFDTGHDIHDAIVADELVDGNGSPRRVVSLR